MPGNWEPPLNVGGAPSAMSARLLSNMPHRGPHSVGYMIGPLVSRHNVRAERFLSPGPKGAETVCAPKG